MALKRRQQRRSVNGLDQMIVEAGVSRPLPIFRLTIAGNRDNYYVVKTFFAKFSYDFKAIHSGQSDIEKDYLRFEFPSYLDCTKPIVRRLYIMSHRLQ